MSQTVSLGAQDFAYIRENNCFLVDKTDFIREWWENKDAVTLITRPRRFGKTLNLSMMECFFSVAYKNRNELFEGLSIWKKEEYRKLQGTYPVIFMSFANIKGSTFQSAREGIIQSLVRLYGKYAHIRNAEFMSPQDLEFFDSVRLEMSDTTAALAVSSLSDYLSRYYGKKVLIFLDEYDTPLQEAYVNGFWKELVDFMRGLFNATFKSNPFLERGLLTGITRVSKESIFSDLNNLTVVTTTSEKYSTQFGFTQDEVSHALEEYGLVAQKEKVNEIDSIRSFDPESQRSLENLEEITIYPAVEHIGETDMVSFLDYFPEERTIIFLDEPNRLTEKGKAVEEEYRQSRMHREEKGSRNLPENWLCSFEQLQKELNNRNCISVCALEPKQTGWKVWEKFYLEVKSVNAYNNSFELLVKDLHQYKKQGSW